jgi:thioredoxin-related protein
MNTMKKVVIAYVLLMATVLFAEIAWQKDLGSAFKKAQNENKVMMVMVEGKYCKWCKKMKYRTLRDKNVEKRLAPYVMVKVMEEDENAVNTLPKTDGIPTIFFMTADKKVLESVVGYYDAEDFISFIESVEQKIP